MEDMGLTELLFRRSEAQSNVFLSALIPNVDLTDELSSDPPSVDSLLVACLKPVPPGEMDRQRIMVHSCLGDSISIRPVSKPLHSSSLTPDTEVVALKAEYCSVKGEEPFLMLAFAFVKRKCDAGICIHRLPLSEMRDLTKLQGKVLLPLESATVMALKTPPWQIICAKFSQQGELKLAILVSHIFSTSSSSDSRPLSMFTLRRNGEFMSVSNYQHFFPEFRVCEDQIFCMESVFVEERMERLTIWGTDTGLLNLTIVALSYENDVKRNFTFAHSTPITSLRLFPEFILPKVRLDKEREFEAAISPPFHLVVSSAAEPTVVYADPCNRGIGHSNQILLTGSGDFDCVLCSCLVDIDLDGVDEILLGTYSGSLLAYKPNSVTSPIEYAAVSVQKVGGPVLAIHVGDMTGDGVKEIAVVTTRGVHIMQYPLQDVMKHLENVVTQEALVELVL